MAEAGGLVSLHDIFPADKEFIGIVLSEDIYVVCVSKRDKKKRSMPFKVLYDNNKQFWAQAGGWDYFLTAETFSNLKNKADALRAGMRSAAFSDSSSDGQDEGGGFGKDYDAIVAMTNEQRVERIGENKKRLDGLSQKTSGADNIAAAIVDTTGNTALINHAALMEAMRLSDNEARKQTQSLVDSTCDMVKSSVRLVSKTFDDELMNTLVAKSNGTIIQHMTRVYLKGIAFLFYYNNLISASSYINKLRVSFEKKYKNFYLPLLPNIEPSGFTLERVFHRGMRAIPHNCILDWAVGFLLHDVGKAAAVEYHEGEAAYNRDIVVDHVKVGYDSVMNKTNYPTDAGLITGYHHEYYGDSEGYGCYREALERCKKTASGANYCIAYDVKPVLNYETLSFFPAKMLEIVDVYDSVTDPKRKYRKPLGSEEALAMMRSEFIEKHRKIDVILFDVFSSFIHEKAAGKTK